GNPLPALADRFHPDDAPALLAWLGAATPSPAQFAANVRIRRPGKDWTPARFEASVGTDTTGAPARITGRIADRSEQRDAEAAVAAMREAALRARDRHARAELMRHMAMTTAPVKDRPRDAAVRHVVDHWLEAWSLDRAAAADPAAQSNGAGADRRAGRLSRPPPPRPARAPSSPPAGSARDAAGRR
ncbi:hypothetical protein L6R53_33710, partial [Myxococcota bacterium]|nr:hypothetical protein [Myxococcota bacterium]